MKRSKLLDLWRSLALLLMLVYHSVYDLEQLGLLAAGTATAPWALVLRYVCAGSFILISGMALHLSRDPVRRGFIIFCAGLAVALVTALAGMPVLFGILQCIGVCMIFFGLLRPRLERLRSWGWLCLWLVLFVGTWRLTNGMIVDIKFLYPLGLRAADFYSADYYPLLPWAFLYLCGVRLGNRRESLPVGKGIPAWLCWPGRNSLWIYLLHQPLLYGICLLLARLT